ncbi:hypothetical protein JCM10207_001480 [Rhodosporidiobolus poonsookiae]
MRFSLLTALAAAAAVSAAPCTDASATATAASSSSTAAGSTSASTWTFEPPTIPALEYLYTAFVICPADLLDQRVGPLGQRKAIPIVGGNVTLADGTKGQIRDLGADEGLVDPKTGIFSADTRYHAVLDDGTDLFFQTSGPKQADSSLHLRIKIETAAPEWYHLNNRNVVGVLHNVGKANNVSTLRIDAFNMEGEWTNTTFLEQ